MEKRNNERKRVLNKIYKKTKRDLEIIEKMPEVDSIKRPCLNSVPDPSFSNVVVHEAPIEDSSATCTSDDNDDTDNLKSNHNGNGPIVENEPDAQYILSTPLESIHTEKSLNFHLGQWAMGHNITQSAVTNLLHILKPYHPELPLDARTLMNTPRAVVLKKVEPGQYHHFGFKKCIERFITAASQLSKHNSNVIEFSINVDGLPLSKSSGSQLYPILCSVFGQDETVEVIGVYHGNEKPADANEFLSEFVTEAIDVLNNGVTFNSRHFVIKVKAFVCDIPAKSFIKYTKGHNGYSSCTKCNTVGTFINNRVCFPEVDNLYLRTDSNFRSKVDEDHHTGTSILELLPGVDMIRNFPMEYMHLICLGVVKKLLLSLWIGGKPGVKLSYHQITTLSDALLSYNSQIPTEFSRKPRSLTEAKRWKATEFRLFLFYLGPVVLRSVLDNNKYLHFLTLHVALSCLSSSELSVKYAAYVESLLKYFVKIFITLYGSENVSQNIHNLLHLCEDVKYLGPLDQFSAFPFENYMQSLKKLVRKGDKPLEQITRRLYEQESIYSNPGNDIQVQYPQLLFEHSDGPLISNHISCKQYKKVKFSNYILRLSKPDNCCCIRNGSIITIMNVIVHLGEILVIGKKFMNLENFYTSPCESSKLGILICSNPGSLESWPLSQVKYKCMKLERVYNKMESTTTWTIVNFIHEESVEAVPTTWLLGSKKCYWPPFPKEKIVYSIRKHESPNTCWPLHDINIFRNGTYDSYLIARSKARKAEIYSDLNSDTDKKSRKFKKLKIIESSSDEENEAWRSQTSPLPAPPIMPNSDDDETDMETSMKVHKSPNASMSAAEKGISSISADVRHSSCCCCADHKMGDNLKVLLKQQVLTRHILNEVLDEMRKIRTDMADMRTSMTQNDQTSSNSTSIFVAFEHFPIDAVDKLKLFENYLRETEQYKAAVKEFSKIGGSTTYEFMKRCLCSILTDKFASEFSWQGAKKKKVFGQLKLAQLLLEAGELNGISATRKSSEEAIKNWLRRAKERHHSGTGNKESRRNQEKDEGGYNEEEQPAESINSILLFP